jgi:two-component system LytT family response regulator
MGARHVVIVDDERLARRELRTLLQEAHAGRIRVVGEAASVEEAAKLVRATDPDAVFLDIHLGEESGLDLLPAIGEDTHIVFVTAYDRYAIRAFEVNALDYLLKPVVPERLAETVERLESRTPAAEERPGPLAYEDRMFLRLDERRRFLRVGDIVAAVADRDSSILHLPDGEKARASRSLKEWEDRLPDRSFVRIHRSTIVNLEHVERLEDWTHGSYLVYLHGTREPFRMSRRFAARVRARLG